MKSKLSKKKNENSIDYADKYIYGSNYSDKFDSMRIDKKGKHRRRNKSALKALRCACIVALCLAFVCLGYFTVSVTMERHAYKESGSSQSGDKPDDNPGAVDVRMGMTAQYVSPEYLDGASALDSVIARCTESGVSGVIFDLKRENGTLAYKSNVTPAATFNAVASPGENIEKSVEILLENNIIPIARVYCFRDNTAPLADNTVALKTQGGEVLKKGKSAYIDPANEYACAYLADIIKEISSMGITNIVLDGLEIPSGERQSEVASFVKGLEASMGDTVRIMPSGALTLTQGDDVVAAVDTVYQQNSDLEIMPVITSDIEQKALISALGEAKISNYLLIVSTSPDDTATENHNE